MGDVDVAILSLLLKGYADLGKYLDIMGVLWVVLHLIQGFSQSN
jgi:hypothetical protein